MLAPLKIGQTYFVPKQAEMAGHGHATVTANPRPGVYTLRFADGTTDTLTDSE